MFHNLKLKALHALMRNLGYSSSPASSYAAYSQEGEDILLWRIISPHTTEKGTYVEVGSNDPWKYSNTGFFYEKGWRGIAIDPNPDFSESFQKERPEDIFLQIGISDRPSNLTYYKFDVSFYNTFSKEAAEDILAKQAATIIHESQVAVVPLATALLQVWPHGKEIDLLSIDAEGLDYQIIQSHDFNKFPVKYVIAECDCETLDQVSANPISKYLSNLGYAPVSKLCKSIIFFHSSQLYKV